MNTPPIQNRSIARLLTIQQQIAHLIKIKEKGEHIAAGLTIDLHVGVPKEDADPLCFEVSSYTEVLLQTMIESMRDSERFWIHQIKREHRDLQAFVETLPRDPNELGPNYEPSKP